MGLIYNNLIATMKKDFKKSGNLSLESFLKDKKIFYQDEYKLPNELILLNIDEILKQEGIESDYFKNELFNALMDNN
jgi:hypothetical protein